MDVQIGGQAELRKIAAHIRATGDKGLGREFAKALEKAVDPVKEAIVAEAEKTMPSGYKSTLTRSLKHRRTTRASGREASVRLATHGEGKRERRDLPALNAGKLRHPVYGRSRMTKTGRQANPWAVTRIRAGFFDRAIEKAADQAERAILAVVDDFTDRLAKG